MRNRSSPAALSPSRIGRKHRRISRTCTTSVKPASSSPSTVLRAPVKESLDSSFLSDKLELGAPDLGASFADTLDSSPSLSMRRVCSDDVTSHQIVDRSFRIRRMLHAGAMGLRRPTTTVRFKAERENQVSTYVFAIQRDFRCRTRSILHANRSIHDNQSHQTIQRGVLGTKVVQKHCWPLPRHR